MAGRVTTQLIVEGVNRTRQMFNEVNRDLNVTNKALAASGKLLAGYLTFSALAAGVKAVANTADAYQAMNARLRLATGSQEEFNTALEELQRIAYNTGQPVEALVTLYGRISRPSRKRAAPSRISSRSPRPCRRRSACRAPLRSRLRTGWSSSARRWVLARCAGTSSTAWPNRRHA